MCLRHNSSAAECSWHTSVLLHSHNKQNQQGKNLSFFWGRFPAVGFMIDALRQCLKLMPLMWCRADVCVLWEHFFCMINIYVILCYCSLKAVIDKSSPSNAEHKGTYRVPCAYRYDDSHFLPSFYLTDKNNTVWKPPANEEKKSKPCTWTVYWVFLRAWHLYLQSFLNAAKRFTLLFPFCHTLFFL